MALLFEWDEAKATASLRKHGVDFFEAQTVFGDPNTLTLLDEQHSIVEERLVDLGMSSDGRLLVVVYTEREATIRIISCHEATSAEQRQYGQRAR